MGESHHTKSLRHRLPRGAISITLILPENQPDKDLSCGKACGIWEARHCRRAKKARAPVGHFVGFARAGKLWVVGVRVSKLTTRQ